MVAAKPAKAGKQERRAMTLTSMITNQQDAPTCPNCGNVVVRNGACYKCLNCGESLGCS
jgi:ribonucleoside-diphosphate reductase alpha chain